MSSTNGFWSSVVNAIRHLFAAPAVSPAAAVAVAQAPVVAEQPASSNADDAASAPAADLPLAARAAAAVDLLLAARLAVTAKLNTRKGRKPASASRSNRPAQPAKVVSKKRTAARPVWIGAEIRNRETMKLSGKATNVVPLRPKAVAKHPAKASTVRTAGTATRRAA